MRNLKKILALVLALVMSLSLMATAGAGSFQDVTDDNPYKTAIDVLDQLKVFQGFEDGSFKPTDTLNRAQAAVLVYRIATGDVEGKQVDNYTYMAQSKFTDLDGYNWAKGYINYCQNAGIVVGTDATHFNPGGKVTGYQLLVMLLRTLGYGKAGEFADPKGWELQTASIAKREGILENITNGNFGEAAPRQMVAEILFRGLLKETVQYSALTPGGYTKTGETLGKKNLGLEEITGVVVANEYADLRDDDPLAADKTAMVVGDETYTLDKGTTLDDIGEARHAYIQNGSTVLYLADAGNTTEESTDAEKVDDVLSRAGITKGSADEYINFGKGSNWKSPWRIKYVIDLGKLNNDAPDLIENATLKGFILPEEYWDDADKEWINGYDVETVKDADDNDEDHLTYTATFAIKVDITSDHQNNIKKIFNIADKKDSYITGEVYAGTTSKEDLSDKITLDDFIADYITDDAMDPVSKNEKGNWLKVIDNNGDGKADYILKVIYTGAQVERVKDDKITLDVKDHSLVTGTAGSGHDRIGVNDDINTLTSQKVAPMDDAALEEGDVVYYAIIDGVARAYKAEMVTATIDKINRNTKSTTTEDGTEYFESGVCNHILNTEYKDQVTDLVGKVKFDLYFDRGGWLLTFIKSNRASDFKLITDGWYNSTKSGKEYAVKVYDEEEDKQVTVDLISGGNMFVGRDVEYWDRVAGKIRTTDNNDWLALKYLGGTIENDGAEDNFIRSATPNTVTCAPAALNGADVDCTIGAAPDYFHTHGNSINAIRTTVASIDEEGNILPVEDYRITGRYDHAMIDVKDNKVPTSAYTAGTAYDTSSGSDTAYDDAGIADAVELRALSTTKYYVVWPASDGVSVGGVKAFTGYSSVSSIKALASKDADYDLVEDVYAVGTETTRDNYHGNAIYYTADIVVVELNDTPVNARTMVLLVDDEGQVDKTGLRHVQIIDEDGSSKWIDTKDYESSQLKAREYEKKLQPGLYYMTKVSSDPELYKLEVMTGADIRDAECFISGQVQYYRGTTRNDYVVVNPCVNSDPEDGTSYTILGNDKTVEPIITEKSKFYELGYGFDGWTYNNDGDITGVNYTDYRKEAASLSDEDDLTYRDVVEGRVEGVGGKRADKTVRTDDYYDSADGQSYFYNDVLIRTDSDNKIVWAVSFQNTYNNAGDSDFAQFVWLNTMPDAPKATPDSIIEDAKALFTDEDYDTLKDAYTSVDAKTMLESTLEDLNNIDITKITVADATIVLTMVDTIEAALEDIDVEEYRTEAKTWLKNYADVLKAGIDATGTDKALIEAAIDAKLDEAIKEDGTIDLAGTDTTKTVAERKTAIDSAKATAAGAMDAAAGAAVGNTLVANFDGATVTDTSSVEKGTGFSATIPTGTKPAGQKLTFTFDTKKELEVSASSTDTRVDSIAIEGGESVRAAASSFKTVTITVTLTREAAVDAMNGLATDLVITLTVSDPVEVPDTDQSTTTVEEPVDVSDDAVKPVNPVNAGMISIAKDDVTPSEGTEKNYKLTAAQDTTLSQNEDGDNIVETYMTLADGFEVKSDPAKGITAEKVNAGQNLMTAQKLESVLWKITINVTVYNAYAESTEDVDPVAVKGNVLDAELVVPVVVDVVKETSTAADWEADIKAALDEEGGQFPVSMLVVFSDQIEYEIDAVNHKVVVTGTVDKKYGATELNKDVSGKLSEAENVSDEYKAVCHWWYQVEDLDKADRDWNLNPWTHMRQASPNGLGEFNNIAFIAVPCGEAADGSGINLLLVAVHDRADADFSEVTYTFDGVEWTVDASAVADSLSA